MSTLWSQIRNLALLLAAGFLVASASYGKSTAETAPELGTATKPDFQIVSFDDAMKDQIIRSMPLKLAFPADYAMHVLEPAINGVIWARRADRDEIARTGNVPGGAGLFHGRLTMNVGYDSSRNAFCGPDCDEKKWKESMEAAGADNVKFQRHVANGIPLLLIELGTSKMPGSLRKKLYLAYIAVLIDTNVMLISYSPPSDSNDDGAGIWQAFTRALTESNVAAAPDQSPTPKFEDYLEQSARSQAFQAVATDFIAAAAAGDGTTSLGLISPNLLKTVGLEAVQSNLTDQVLPFFAAFSELGRSVSIARTQDEFGSAGFVLYLSMTPKQGKPRPFAIYVVDENGSKFVANILLDHEFKDSRR